MKMTKRLLSIPGILATFLTSGMILADAGGIDFYSFIPVNNKIQTSSTLVEKGQPESRYGGDKVMDNDPKTAWCEGRPDAGIGEWIHVQIKPTPLKHIFVAPGIIFNRSLYNMNNRIKDYELEVFLKNGRNVKKRGTFTDNSCAEPDDRICYERDKNSDECLKNLKTQCDWARRYYSGQFIDISQEKINVTNPYDEEGKSHAVPKPECVTGFKLTILSVYPGAKSNDTCVSEFGKLIFIDASSEWDSWIQTAGEDDVREKENCE